MIFINFLNDYFHVDKTGTPLTPAFKAGGLIATTNTKVNEPLYICCTNYQTEEERLAHHKIFTATGESYLLAYPNPNDGSELLLDYKMENDTETFISVINIMGIAVYNQNVEKVNNGEINHAALNLSHLLTGMYIIQVRSKTQQLSTQLLIIK